MARRAPRESLPADDLLLSLEPRPDVLERWARRRGSDGPAFSDFQHLVLGLLRERPLRARELIAFVERAGAVGDAPEAILLRRLRAHVAKATGDLAAALADYAGVADALQERGDEVEAARTVIGWSDALALAGRIEPALDLLDDARSRIASVDPAAAARLEGTAATVHYLAGRLDEARALYEKAKRRARRRDEIVDVAVCDFNLGNVELLRGRAGRARSRYEAARACFAARGLELAVLQCRYGIAAADLQRGDWPESVSEFDRVAEALRERGDRRGAAAIDHDAAELLASLGADLIAETHARRARADFAAMGLVPEQARAAALQARLLARLGRAHDAHRRLEEARRAYASMGRRDALAPLALEQARIDLGRGRLQGVEPALRRLQDAASRRGDRVLATRCRALRAEVALAEERPARALRLARRAHRDAQRHPLRTERPGLASVVARALAVSGRSREAVNWARRAVRDVEALGRSFGHHAEALGLGGVRDRIAATAVDIVLDHGGPDAARVAVQLLMAVRAGSVVEDLLRGRRRAPAEEVRAALARLRDRLFTEDGGADDVRVRSLRGELDRLERRLRLDGSHERIPGAPSFVATGSAQWRRRASGRPVVVFDRRGRGWGAFVMDRRGRVRHQTLPRAEEAIRESWLPLRMLLEALAKAPAPQRARLLDRSLEEARSSLRGLAESLWSPLALDAEEVVLVASGAINGIGLEASLLESFGDDAPVLARVPHPDLLLDERRAPRRRALLLEGTVPGARTEVEKIRERLARAGWTSRIESTRAGFLAARERWGLVHLATHGSFHRSRWISNGLQLHDGWIGFEQLDPRHVAGATLYFDSCESGLAHQAPGAELDGWASAGFAAGAREMVLNLWKVDDASAIRFATAFYDTWCEGGGAAHAAQTARCRVRREHPHPFAWAGGIVASRQPFGDV